LAALDEGVGTVEFASAGRADGETGDEAGGVFDAGRWRAEREWEHAAHWWDAQHYPAAAEHLRRAAGFLAPVDPRHRRWSGLALAAEGFGLKEASAFAAAEKRLHEARVHWPADEVGAPAALRELARVCRETGERCGRFAKLQEGERSLPALRDLIGELVDQSVRAARVERYDEASLRLGRAIEMELQLRFAEATGSAYWWGRLVKGAKVPEALRNPSLMAQLQRTEPPREWSPEAIVHGLHALAERSVDDLWQDLTDWRGQSEWRTALAVRHGSVWARSGQPVDKAGHKGMRKAAGRFLGMQLAEQHPIPAFDRNGW
jgi:hypothetical protein